MLLSLCCNKQKTKLQTDVESRACFNWEAPQKMNGPFLCGSYRTLRGRAVELTQFALLGGNLALGFIIIVSLLLSTTITIAQTHDTCNSLIWETSSTIHHLSLSHISNHRMREANRKHGLGQAGKLRT